MTDVLAENEILRYYKDFLVKRGLMQKTRTPNAKDRKIEHRIKASHVIQFFESFVIALICSLLCRKQMRSTVLGICHERLGQGNHRLIDSHTVRFLSYSLR